MAAAAIVQMLCLGAHGERVEADRPHGYVGLRPLPRNVEDLKSNHGGPWSGLPTFEEQKGNYPFVARHLDVVKGWLDGDFSTRRVFFEYYWGLSEARDDLDPSKNLLVRTIADWESRGGVVEHILICREYRLAIHRGHEEAKPGPFQEDTRILFAEDVDNIRVMFRNAHEQGLLKHDDYRLMQMVEEPSFFAENPEAQAIVQKMEGVAYECHQFNRHWPLETGWSRPEKVVRGAKWTLDQGKEYIFYYGPIVWKSPQYHDFIERDWLHTYWKAGLPKHHPRMHYYLNTFPHAHGRGRPIGPESDPHSVLGMTKWLILEIRRDLQKQENSSRPHEGVGEASVPRVQADAGAVVGHLETRDKLITIHAGSDGPLYTVMSPEGTVLAARLSRDQLTARFPELKAVVEQGVAGGRIWAGF